MNEVDTGTGTQRLIPKSPAVDLLAFALRWTAARDIREVHALQ